MLRAAVDRSTGRCIRDVHGIQADVARLCCQSMPVDASQTPIAPSQARVTAGAFVSVQGRISGGTLLAPQVTVLTTSVIDTRVFQVSGTVSGLDAAAKTFTVRNVEVDYRAAAFTAPLRGLLMALRFGWKDHCRPMARSSVPLRSRLDK